MDKVLNSIEIKEQNILNKNKKKNKNFKNNFFSFMKKYYIIMILILIVILVSVLTYFILNSFKYKKYEKYEEKMNIYGFNKLYDNESCKTDEFVTRSEVTKLMLGVIFNTYDISNLAKEDTSYNNATWAEYANDMNLVREEINKDNYNDKIKYSDAIYSFYNTKQRFLKDKKLLKESNINIKDIDKYLPEVQVAIKDFVDTRIINIDDNDKIKGNQYLVKGLVNEMAINIAEKYGTILVGKDDKININKDNVPSNYVEYPYTLANVNKEIYEIPFDIKNNNEEVYNPSKLYKFQKNEISQAKNYIEDYYNILLNVDYETIDADKFKYDLKGYCLPVNTKKDIEKYVNHVKENKIKLSGKVKAILPVFYYDGSYYRMRVHFKFDIKNSDTNKNLLFNDGLFGINYNYLDKKYDFYADCYMMDGIGSDVKYIYNDCLYNAILDKDNVAIKKEVPNEK